MIFGHSFLSQRCFACFLTYFTQTRRGNGAVGRERLGGRARRAELHVGYVAHWRSGSGRGARGLVQARHPVAGQTWRGGRRPRPLPTPCAPRARTYIYAATARRDAPHLRARQRVVGGSSRCAAALSQHFVSALASAEQLMLGIPDFVRLSSRVQSRSQVLALHGQPSLIAVHPLPPPLVSVMMGRVRSSLSPHSLSSNRAL